VPAHVPCSHRARRSTSMTALNCTDGMGFAARSKSVTVVHRFGFSNGRLTVGRWESAGAIGTLDLTEQLAAVASRDLLEFGYVSHWVNIGDPAATIRVAASWCCMTAQATAGSSSQHRLPKRVTTGAQQTLRRPAW
jgi:hypothetical protein